MYQLEFDNIVNSERGVATVRGLLDREPAVASDWDSLLAKAAAIALASRSNQHIVAFDLLLEDPGAMRDFMQSEFAAHPEELLE